MQLQEAHSWFLMMATTWELVNGRTGIWTQVCLTQNLCSHPLCYAEGSVRSNHLSEGPVCFPGETEPIASLFALSGTWAPYDGQHLPTPHFEAQVLDAQLTRILVRCPRHLELSQLLKPGHLGVHVHLWGDIERFLREPSGQRVSATSIQLCIGGILLLIDSRMRGPHQDSFKHGGGAHVEALCWEPEASISKSEAKTGRVFTIAEQKGKHNIKWCLHLIIV